MSSSIHGNFISAHLTANVDANMAFEPSRVAGTNAAVMRAFSGARPHTDPKRADKPSKSDRDMADPTPAVA
jgi:hypothetical protein